MSETTRISWTDATWNPWIGCRKVSPGCKNCYAERLVTNRMGRDFREVRRASDATFNAPLRWEGPKRVFTCSISDFFIEEADAWREEAWDVIAERFDLTFQILTKRPERIADHLPFDWGQDGWDHVWLGTSVESQDVIGKRVVNLVEVPAKVHFLSVEPMLGQIYLDFDEYYAWETDLEWIICGGESGPNFRPMQEEWVLSLRDQCKALEIPFFFKQHSGPRSEMGPALEGREYREMPKAWGAQSLGPKRVPPSTPEENPP